MRWKVKPKAFVGQKKVFSKFLLLPKKADGECRWLEIASMEMQYMKDLETGFRRWCFIGFVDEEEVNK